MWIKKDFVLNLTIYNLSVIVLLFYFLPNVFVLLLEWNDSLNVNDFDKY